MAENIAIINHIPDSVRWICTITPGAHTQAILGTIDAAVKLLYRLYIFHTYGSTELCMYSSIVFSCHC
jgi:hypothetical protein